MYKLPMFMLIIFSNLVLFSCTPKSATEEKKLNKTIEQEKTITGTLVKVGNEPFTKLTIFINNSTAYNLKCSEKIYKELDKEQGQKVKLFYTSKEKTYEGITLTVTKFNLIKSETK